MTAKFFELELEKTNVASENSGKNFQSVYLEMLEAQRMLLDKMNEFAEFAEELIRKYLGLIDVEEFKISEKQLPESQFEQSGN